MDNYEYNELLKSLKIKIDNIAKVINPSSIESRLSEIESLEQDPSFWSDIELASQIGKEKTKLNSMLSKFQNAQNALNDATELFDLANSENDLDTINSLFEDSENLEDLITRSTYHSNAIEGSTLTYAETYAKKEKVGKE